VSARGQDLRGSPRLRSGCADADASVVIVWKFDRFARSAVSHLLRALEAFNSPRISFVNLSEAMDTATPIMRVPKFFRISVTQVLSYRELIAA
jgi:DNA invertase Pin-like site-specific DNA recombinase